MRATPLVVLFLAACSFTHGGASNSHGDGSITGGDGGGSDSVVTGNGFQKPITVQHGMVAGDITGFPVWVAIAGDTDLETFAQSDHSDVYFTDATGAAIPFEITGWDKATGVLQAWVRANHLTPASGGSPDPNLMYLRFGGPTGALTSSGAAVFDNGFRAVWHFDDNASLASIPDATGNAPGTVTGTAPTSGAAWLGNGLTFANTSTAIMFQNPIPGTAASTISAWVNEAPKGGNVYAYAVVVVGSSMKDKARWLYSLFGGDGDSVAAGLYSDDHAPTPHVIASGTWTKLDWTVDSTGNSSIYINGNLIDTANLGNPNTNGGKGLIGNTPPPLMDWSQDGSTAFFGTLDEVRIANTVRSSAWLQTEYNNQSSPTSFYTVGARQPL